MHDYILFIRMFPGLSLWSTWIYKKNYSRQSRRRQSFTPRSLSSTWHHCFCPFCYLFRLVPFFMLQDFQCANWNILRCQAEVYHAYNLVHRYRTEPFSAIEAEAIFLFYFFRSVGPFLHVTRPPVCQLLEYSLFPGRSLPCVQLGAPLHNGAFLGNRGGGDLSRRAVRPRSDVAVVSAGCVLFARAVSSWCMKFFSTHLLTLSMF